MGARMQNNGHRLMRHREVNSKSAKINGDRDNMKKRSSKKASSSEEGLTRGKLIVLVGVLVVLGAATVALQFFFGGPDEVPMTLQTDPAGGRPTVLTAENLDLFQAQHNQPTQDGYYRTKMNVEWVFDTWDSPSENAYVANSGSNTRTVYFDVILNDTQQTVYSSPYIPVGRELTDFALDEPLAAGIYGATVVYHLVDDDNAELTTVSVSVTLYIQK